MTTNLQKNKEHKRYHFNQCALYKMISKKKLCEMLYVELKELKDLLRVDDNYLVFSYESKPIIPHEQFVKKPRTIQALKEPLKTIHKRIFKLLKNIDVPSYLHSAVKCRSYRSNAESHINSLFLHKVDIKKFYQSISEKKVFEFFYNTLRCSEDVSILLSKICCWKNMLPTGSPLSPILSFLVNMRMFDRLYAYARLNELRMTVYIDDITFSGEIITKMNIFEIDKIIINNGYRPHKKNLSLPNNKKIVTGLILEASNTNIPPVRRLKVRKLIEYAQKAKLKKLTQIIESLIGYKSEATQFDRNYAHFIKARVSKLKRRRQYLVSAQS